METLRVVALAIFIFIVLYFAKTVSFAEGDEWLIPIDTRSPTNGMKIDKAPEGMFALVGDGFCRDPGDDSKYPGSYLFGSTAGWNYGGAGTEQCKALCAAQPLCTSFTSDGRTGCFLFQSPSYTATDTRDYVNEGWKCYRKRPEWAWKQDLKIDKIAKAVIESLPPSNETIRDYSF